MDNNLPTGFISVEEAIKLIESDTRSDAKVDPDFLLRNLPFLRVDGNYTIRKKKHEKGRVVDDGNTRCHIFNDYQRSMLEHAIVEHYKQASGRDIDPETIGIRKLSTEVDDENNPQGRIISNRKSSTKVGDNMMSGNTAPQGFGE